MILFDDDYDDWDDSVTIESDLGVLFLNQDETPSVLEQVKGAGAPRSISLMKVYLVLGRGQTADIRLDSSEVSRSHAALRKVGKEFVCEDMESRNGVHLNGVKIHSATLREGDTLQMGNVVFIYHEGS
ncbi:MAG: FHA domain-containing protein [Deltaproteobacteria bacterium]|nr:FHA domain-containing protein [Deltaproteobacteria bacterium]